MDNSEIQAAPRSTFVSVVAWVFIVFTGFGTLMSLMQSIMFHTMFSMPEMQTAMDSADSTAGIPPYANFMFNHFELIFLLFFLMTLFALISSIGLLKRKNWARKVFIGILGISILLLLVSVVAQYLFFYGAGMMGTGDIPAEMRTMMNYMQLFFTIVYGGLAVVMGLIVRKLLSPGVVQEFRPSLKDAGDVVIGS